MNMAGKLAGLLDFQRFQGNGRLQSLIEETEGRYLNDLSDEELEWVSAAGEQTDPKDMENGHGSD